METETYHAYRLISMGMFILDEVHFEDGSGRDSVYDIIGGAGTYAVLGARYFLSKEGEKNQTGFIVDKGSDFPEAVQKELDAWGVDVLYRDTPNRLTTRGTNVYRANDAREFGYVSPGIRIEGGDLPQNMLRTQCLHLICSPARCLNISTVIRERVGFNGDEAPLLIWEPFPGECKPEKMEECRRVLEFVDVFSPNAKEAGMFLGIQISEPIKRAQIEDIGKRYLGYLGKPNSLIVIRCGADGAVVFSQTGTVSWFPAYHEDTPEKVIDPTGGGNSFLGGFALGFIENNINKAGVYGNVAAGLAIEQIGLPKLGMTTDNVETWNSEVVQSRIEKYCQKTGIEI